MEVVADKSSSLFCFKAHFSSLIIYLYLRCSLHLPCLLSMSFMSLTLNLLFFALLPPRGVRQPAFLIKVKVAFCLLSFVWFPRLPWLLDELGDSQGLWRHVWISETGTCVQRLGGVVMFGGRGFAGTILEEFREPFSFYAGTRTKRKSGVLYICVIFQTSNNKGFSNKLLLCYV